MYQNTIRGMAMLVSETMSSCAECAEDTPVDGVYELIQKCGHGFVVVSENESQRVPRGLVTENSICEQIIAEGRRLRGLTVRPMPGVGCAGSFRPTR